MIEWKMTPWDGQIKDPEKMGTSKTIRNEKNKTLKWQAFVRPWKDGQSIENIQNKVKNDIFEIELKWKWANGSREKIFCWILFVMFWNEKHLIC